MPHLVPVTRGILTTIFARPSAGADAAAAARCWEGAYRNESFVRLLPTDAFPELRHVVRSNYIDLAMRHDPRTGHWLFFSALDNVVKGAAGQAIHILS